MKGSTRAVILVKVLSSIPFWTIILNFFQNSSAHPQCLDFKPPFQAGATLSFCPMYSSFGCCTVENDSDLRKKYDAIGGKVRSELWRECAGFLRELMCQKCSPYAAHIYDAEDSFKPRSFPGLCNKYCNNFFSKCSRIIPYMTDDVELQYLIPHGANATCEHVGLIDKDYCYPELKHNPILNNKISIKQVTSEGCLCVEEITSGLKNPILARHAGDGSNRLFVAEVTGKVYVYYTNGSREMEPFLDIQRNVVNSVNEGDERGFLGMAFHPNFKNNQKFYIYYSAVNKFNDSNDHVITISEMKVSNIDRNKANASSERVLLEVVQPFWNHNGGEILFGDDNYLYLFVGDGGSGGDPLGNGQNRSTLLGKVLRIDVDGRTGNKPYGIPRDNPFLGIPRVLPEIYAYGVRNIWRCGKDRGDPQTGYGKGRIICGDVGQSTEEELDLLKKGANYGWNAKEGSVCFKKYLCNNIGNTEAPIHSYRHYVGKSVTGGHFYRGCRSPNLNGFYIYGDYMTGKLFRMVEKSSGWNNKELNMCKSDMCKPPLQSFYSPHIMSFGEDEEGELYMLSTKVPSSGLPLGSVYKIVDPARRGNPKNCKSARDPYLDLQRTNTNVFNATNDYDYYPTSTAAPQFSIGIARINVFASKRGYTSLPRQRPTRIISQTNRRRHRKRTRPNTRRKQRARNSRRQSRRRYRSGTISRRRKERLRKRCIRHKKKTRACQPYYHLYQQ